MPAQDMLLKVFEAAKDKNARWFAVHIPCSGECAVQAAPQVDNALGWLRSNVNL